MTVVLILLIAIGAIGYLLLLPALLELRLALGKRSAGLGQILVDGLLGLVVLLFVLLTWSLTRMVMPAVQTLPQEAMRLLLAAAFALHPLWVLWQLWGWRARLAQADEPLAAVVEKAIVVSLEESKEEPERG